VRSDQCEFQCFAVCLLPAALLFLTHFRGAKKGGDETLFAPSASSIRNFSRIVFGRCGA
jgi:hypothetical protein